jgi:hypothetical protein
MRRSAAGSLGPFPREEVAEIGKIAVSIMLVNLFAECRSFAQAFRLARDHIGADEPLMIEAEATDDPD